MGPFWVLLIGMLLVWAIHNNLLINLINALTAAAPTSGVPGGVQSY